MKKTVLSVTLLMTMLLGAVVNPTVSLANVEGQSTTEQTKSASTSKTNADSQTAVTSAKDNPLAPATTNANQKSNQNTTSSTASKDEATTKESQSSQSQSTATSPTDGKTKKSTKATNDITFHVKSEVSLDGKIVADLGTQDFTVAQGGNYQLKMYSGYQNDVSVTTNTGGHWTWNGGTLDKDKIYQLNADKQTDGEVLTFTYALRRVNYKINKITDPTGTETFDKFTWYSESYTPNSTVTPDQLPLPNDGSFPYGTSQDKWNRYGGWTYDINGFKDLDNQYGNASLVGVVNKIYLAGTDNGKLAIYNDKYALIDPTKNEYDVNLIVDADKAVKLLGEYVDEQGKALAPADTYWGFYGQHFKKTRNDKKVPLLDHYDYQKTTGGTETGFYTDQPYFNSAVNGEVNGVPLVSKDNGITKYVYKGKPATLRIQYLDIQGKKVQPDKVITGQYGDDYNYVAKDAPAIKGYKLKGSTLQGGYGTLDDTKTSVVTFTYIKQAAQPLTVKYLDVATDQPIAPTKVYNGLDGETYHELPIAYIPGYQYYLTQGQITGLLYSTQPVNVTHYYYKKPIVTAKYVDENGKKLLDDETQTLLWHDAYTTEQKKVPNYTLKAVTGGAANGNVLDKDITVTYVYTHNQGKAVTAKYVDESGQPIAKESVQTGFEGDKYTTTQKVISGYTFKATTGAPVTGVFSNQAQTVTYVYHKTVSKQSITVNYVDTTGKKLAASTLKQQDSGSKYTTLPLAIVGYTLKTTPANATGTVGDKDITVTYVYTKTPAKSGSVVVNYVDEAGHLIAPSEKLNGHVGEAYQTTQKTIKGYTFKAVSANHTGKYTDQSQVVTYTYKKDDTKSAGVIAKYVDEDGQRIAADVAISGKLGEQYYTSQKSIKGYDYVKVTGAPTGVLSDKPQVVTYHYQKQQPVTQQSHVIVKYLDNNGQSIADTETLTGDLGATYQTTPRSITGYTFKSVTGPAVGKFAKSDVTVTYYYTKDTVTTPTAPEKPTPSQPDTSAGQDNAGIVTAPDKSGETGTHNSGLADNQENDQLFSPSRSKEATKLPGINGTPFTEASADGIRRSAAKSNHAFPQTNESHMTTWLSMLGAALVVLLVGGLVLKRRSRR